MDGSGSGVWLYKCRNDCYGCSNTNAKDLYLQVLIDLSNWNMRRTASTNFIEVMEDGQHPQELILHGVLEGDTGTAVRYDGW